MGSHDHLRRKHRDQFHGSRTASLKAVQRLPMDFASILQQKVADPCGAPQPQLLVRSPPHGRHALSPCGPKKRARGHRPAGVKVQCGPKFRGTDDGLGCRGPPQSLDGRRKLRRSGLIGRNRPPRGDPARGTQRVSSDPPDHGTSEQEREPRLADRSTEIHRADQHEGDQERVKRGHQSTIHIRPQK